LPAIGAARRGSSADEADELLFDDDAGHALCLQSRSESELINGLIAICPYVIKNVVNRSWSGKNGGGVLKPPSY
jgi:hypothetical protein